MVTRWLVEAGTAFKGRDGEVRYIITAFKTLPGQNVTWDSVPLSVDYWDAPLFSERHTRPHGTMTMGEFRDWAIEQVGP